MDQFYYEIIMLYKFKYIPMYAYNKYTTSVGITYVVMFILQSRNKEHSSRKLNTHAHIEKDNFKKKYKLS